MNENDLTINAADALSTTLENAPPTQNAADSGDSAEQKAEQNAARPAPTFWDAFGSRFRYDLDVEGRASRSERWGWSVGATARGVGWILVFELLPPRVLDFFWVGIAFYFFACSFGCGIDFGALNFLFAFKKVLIALTPLAAIFFLPGLSVSVRRLRDFGKSGARFVSLAAIATFALAALVEFALDETDDAKVFAQTSLVATAIDGGFLVYLLGFAPGVPAPDRFGSQPKKRV